MADRVCPNCEESISSAHNETAGPTVCPHCGAAIPPPPPVIPVAKPVPNEMIPVAVPKPVRRRRAETFAMFACAAGGILAPAAAPSPEMAAVTGVSLAGMALVMAIRAFPRRQSATGAAVFALILAIMGLVSTGYHAVIAPLRYGIDVAMNRYAADLNMTRIGVAIDTYQYDHASAFPADLETLVTEGLCTPSDLRCPQTDSRSPLPTPAAAPKKKVHDGLVGSR